MGTPTIIKGEEYFNAVIYEGNGLGQRIGNFVPFTADPAIANSCIFNDDDNPKLTRTQDTGASQQKGTFSWWFKRGSSFGTDMIMFAAAPSSRLFVKFDTSDRIVLRLTNGTSEFQKVTNRTFEDRSKFYHCVWQIDATQGTATDRSKLYIDGNRITSWNSDNNPAQNTDVVGLSDGTTQIIGQTSHSTGQVFDGYMAEFNQVDNRIDDPSIYGQTDTSTGRWIPKTISTTYGTNGVRLTFADASAFGDDTSGNGNDFSSSGLASTDQTTDSPTLNRNNMGGTNNNFTLSEGNLKVVSPGSGAQMQCVGLESMGVSSGKWYWEVKINSKGACGYGWKSDSNVGGSQAISSGTGSRGTIYNVGGSGGFADGEWTDDWVGATSNFSPFTTASNDDVVMFALDLDNRRGYVGLNGTWFNSANPANGTGSIGLGKVTVHAIASKFYPMACRLDASGTGTYNFGGTSFAHTPPTGFLNWNQTTMPETDKGITGLNWIKDRDNGSFFHTLQDSSRGPNNEVYSNSTSSAGATNDSVTRFLKGGVAVEDAVNVNTASDSFVAWNWVANKGTTASNSNGSITSTVQANTTAGFSIVQYTGSGSAATIGHGLSSAPEWIMVKNLSQGDAWKVYHHKVASDPQTDYLVLNTTAALVDDATVWNDTAPTSSVFSIGNHTDVNTNTENYIAYCWNGVEGFSKFGIYTGNNNANGPFIQTNFKPAFVLFKDIDNTRNWTIIDSARDTFNPADKGLFPNDTASEATGNTVDFLSNGFKPRTTGTSVNASAKYVYMAFAEQPFIGDGVSPTTAR